MTVECSKCNQPAVYLRRHTAENLCKKCLIQTTVDRVRRTINREKMFNEADRIAVAISGGKDSAVLLDVINRIETNYPKAEIIPFTIDEGISGYRDKALEAALKLVESLGLNLEIRTFKDLFGYTLDEMIDERGSSRSLGACSYCGVFRRRAINTAAKELSADVVATGHNMDDEAQTVMMNVMRGDSRRIARTNRPRDNSVAGFVPRVKPIVELSERDVVAYAHHTDIPYHDVPCTYANEAYRNDLRVFLNEMEHKRPGTLVAILRSGETIGRAFERNASEIEFGVCENCGEPTPSGICKVCRLLNDLDSMSGG
ncbi:MAG: TIGR00269 family protein [Candidatus Thorarchaeota archaeon]